MDWKVLAFVAGVTLVTGIVFGIAPALRGTGMNVSSALKETSRSVVAGRSVLGKAANKPVFRVVAGICVTGISAMSLALLGSTILGFFGIG